MHKLIPDAEAAEMRKHCAEIMPTERDEMGAKIDTP